MRKTAQKSILAGALALASCTALVLGAGPAWGSGSPTVTIAAVGDTMLGNTPVLPAHPGTYLALVRDALSAPITFGNLEGTLTRATASKCGSGSSQCFAFRVPPSFAGYLRKAGFDVLNSANNHSRDFGAQGVRQTSAAMAAHGIAQTGLRGQIAVVHEGPLKVAFVGFAPYPNVSNLLDLTAAAAVIRKADRRADLVVAYMHAGAEGASQTHVTGREEFFLGEDRGNPEKFAHMAVRQGADLVIASGPHVLRGMELYRHRLIAYSLGDFASYHNFNTDGVLGLSAVLRVTLGPTGWFRDGRIVSVKLNGEGRPGHDRSGAAAHLIARLSKEDFGARGVRVLAHGRIVTGS
ncbi:MAG: CapA family protein [Actinomycetota bacterium]|nr:CapA family protein [Actinomycetota bacterium]